MHANTVPKSINVVQCIPLYESCLPPGMAQRRSVGTCASCRSRTTWNLQALLVALKGLVPPVLAARQGRPVSLHSCRYTLSTKDSQVSFRLAADTTTSFGPCMGMDEVYVNFLDDHSTTSLEMSTA